MLLSTVPDGGEAFDEAPDAGGPAA